MQGQVSISGEAVENSHLFFSRYNVGFVLDTCGGVKVTWGREDEEKNKRIKKNQARFLNVGRVTPFFKG